MKKDHVAICMIGSKFLKPPGHGALIVGHGYAHGPKKGRGAY